MTASAPARLDETAASELRNYNAAVAPAKMSRRLVDPSAPVSAYALVASRDLSKTIAVDVVPQAAAAQVRAGNFRALGRSDNDALDSPDGKVIAIPMSVFRQRFVVLEYVRVADAVLCAGFRAMIRSRSQDGCISIVRAGDRFALQWRTKAGEIVRLPSFTTVAEMIEIAPNPRVESVPHGNAVELFRSTSVWLLDDFVDCHLRHVETDDAREDAMRFQQRYADILGPVLA